MRGIIKIVVFTAFAAAVIAMAVAAITDPYSGTLKIIEHLGTLAVASSLAFAGLAAVFGGPTKRKK